MGGQHTPGPWSMSAGNLIRVHQKGTGVCVAGVHRIGRARDCPEADCVPIANARLIAAAPELLEALQAIVDNTYVGQHHAPVNERSAFGNYRAQYYHKARAAIAKARGQ